MYTLRVYEAYEQDEVREFDSLELAIAHIREHKIFLDDCDLYLTPESLDLYELMNPKHIRRN